MSRLYICLSFLLVLCSCTTPKEKTNETISSSSDSIIKQHTIITDAEVFKWASDLCDNEGTYDSKKYTESQLTGTHHLIFNSYYLETDATPTTPSGVSKLSISTLNEEYEKKLSDLRSMKIINLPYWNNLKKLKIQELEETYQLKKITIEAYTSPQVLLSSPHNNSCKVYVDALTSSDTANLISAWKTMIQEQSKHNGAPERFLQSFREKLESPDKTSFAKIELMTYGWWNCANQHVTHINQDQQMIDEFNKLFTDIKSVCDEP